MLKFNGRFSLIAIAALGISGCGSFAKVVDSNKERKTEHVKFQVNRLNSVDKCYLRADTDAKFQTCAMLQMQIQVEQGFTVRADLDGLPATPEQLLKDGVTDGMKLGAGIYFGGKLIDGLNRPNDIIETPPAQIIDREVPVFIQATPIATPVGE